MLVLVKRWFPAGQISHWDSVFLATAAVVLALIFAASFHPLSLFQTTGDSRMLCSLFVFFFLHLDIPWLLGKEQGQRKVGCLWYKNAVSKPEA